MMNYPPTFLIESDNFADAWYRMLRNVLNNGQYIVANSKSPDPVKTKDAHGIFVLTGKAISDILRRHIHPQFPTKGLHLDSYIEQFTMEALDRWEHQPEEKRFDYLYIGRLHHQFYPIVSKLTTGGINRQTQMILWDVHQDNTASNPPCLQRIWIRILDDTPLMNKPVEVHLSWRSRDLYGAWMSNMVGVMIMLKRYIFDAITPGKYEIVKIVDESDSLHIYNGDIPSALLVKRPVVRLVKQ